MLSSKDYTHRLKKTLHEWQHELVALEKRARIMGGDALGELEQQKLQLQTMLFELQKQVDKLREFSRHLNGGQHSNGSAWRQLSKDLKDSTDGLFPGN